MSSGSLRVGFVAALVLGLGTAVAHGEEAIASQAAVAPLAIDLANALHLATASNLDIARARPRR